MQVHLWEGDRPDRPWRPDRAPSLPEPFGPERMLSLMEDAGVDRAVIVPPAIMGVRNDFALECARSWPHRFAVMGLLDAGGPDVGEQVARWREQPGMVGVRVHFRDTEQDAWPDERLEPFWAAAERHALPVAGFFPGRLEMAERALERHPGLRLVIDHLGLPRIHAGVDEKQFRVALSLARFPHVAVKLSTLASRSRRRSPFADVHGLVHRLLREFGPGRLLWASDHTQQLARGRARYPEELALVRAALADLPDRELALVLGGNAARYLGWPAGIPSVDLAARGS